MDDLSIQGPELEQTLRQLETVNRWLGGYEPSRDAIRSLLRPPLTTNTTGTDTSDLSGASRSARSISILDVGCGHGDTIEDWLRNLAPLLAPSLEPATTLEIRGIDLAATTVAKAAARVGDDPRVTIERRDLFDLDPTNEDDRVDVVHAALLLHHLPGERALEGLTQMRRLARRGVVINDLHRHPVAYHSIWWLTRLLSRNRLIRHDAPLSVARAFTHAELLDLAEHAGFDLASASLRWRWAFRWQLTLPTTPQSAAAATPPL